MEKIEKDNLLHRAFSVFLFNSKYELLLQVFFSYIKFVELEACRLEHRKYQW